VSPLAITSSTVSVPNTPTAISTYRAMVIPKARYVAHGRFRFGSGRSPPVKLITAAEIGEEGQRHTRYQINCGRIGGGGEQLWVHLCKRYHNEDRETASRTITMTDWTRSMKLAPAMLIIATASTTAVANTLLHPGDEDSPEKARSHGYRTKPTPSR
jgi:hypothetical protein